VSVGLSVLPFRTQIPSSSTFNTSRSCAHNHSFAPPLEFILCHSRCDWKTRPRRIPFKQFSYLSDQLLIICLVRRGFRQGEIRPPVRSTRFGYRVAQIGFYPSRNPGNVLQLVSRLLEIADLVQFDGDLLQIISGKPSAIAPLLFVSSPVRSCRPWLTF
jgi:hypothetical protein